jgi:AcrR family transcriptional regulator
LTHQSDNVCVTTTQVRAAAEDQRRREILDAAVAVVVERGFAAARVADVAALAGTSTGTVHYHFPTKADLLDAALGYASDRARDRHRAALDALDDPRQQLLALVELQTPEGPVADEWAMWLEFWNEARRRAEWRERNRAMYAQWSGWIAAIVRDGVARGQFRADVDAEEFARRFAGLLDGLAIQCLLDPTPDHRWQLRRTLVDLVERELLP